MILHRTPYRIAVWLASLAMLFAVLAPTIARARSGGEWVEICSVAGNKLVRSTAATDPAQPESAGATMDCPYCALHSELALPTTPHAVLIHAIEVSSFVPRLFLQAPRALFIWAPAQSRAPPALV